MNWRIRQKCVREKQLGTTNGRRFRSERKNGIYELIFGKTGCESKGIDRVACTF
jgi:hypothetical protein